ncbi:MAG: hypothetical protein CMP39_07850 [Rickettsiales bacterium]|nr:hypothetical protein [Rickettsiales bacterium]
MCEYFIIIIYIMKITKLRSRLFLIIFISIFLINSIQILSQLPFDSDISDLSSSEQTSYNNMESKWQERNIESKLEDALETYESLLFENPSNKLLLQKLAYGYWLDGKFHKTSTSTKYESWYNSLNYSINCLKLNNDYRSSNAISDLTSSDYVCALIKATTIKDFFIYFGELHYADIGDDVQNTESYSDYFGNIVELNTGFSNEKLNEIDEDGFLTAWAELKNMVTEAKDLVESISQFSDLNENNFHYIRNQFLGSYYAKMPEYYGQDKLNSKSNFELAYTNGNENLNNALEYAINYGRSYDVQVYESLLTTIQNENLDTLNNDLLPENTLVKNYAATLIENIDTSYGCYDDYDCDQIITSEDCDDENSLLNVVSENVTISAEEYSSCDLNIIKIILNMNPNNTNNSYSEILSQGTQSWEDKRLISLELKNYSLQGPIPDEIELLNSLVTLNLSNNSISEIPDSIFYISSSLEDLNLNNNQITEFNEKLITLSSLKSLQINNNNISSDFPTNLNLLQELTYLDLSFNNISNELPQNIYRLTNLETLKVNDNNLSGDMPGIINNMWPSLRNLYLQNNKLTGNLPFNIFDLLLLENLDLSCNRLRDFYNTLSEQELIEIGIQDC